jgi:hypothetical protein
VNSRRQFLKTGSSVLPMPLIVGETKNRLPLALSTLGCPKWDWKRVLDFALQHGFAAIELRGLEGNLNLPDAYLTALECERLRGIGWISFL